jgi:hypothetical protein
MGLGIYWPGRFERGANGYYYTVVIGVEAIPGWLDPSAWKTDGVMWFQILRWEDRSRQPTAADAPLFSEFPYYLGIQHGPPTQPLRAWRAAADEMNGGYVAPAWTLKDYLSASAVVVGVAGAAVCIAGACAAVGGAAGVAPCAGQVIGAAAGIVEEAEEAARAA